MMMTTTTHMNASKSPKSGRVLAAAAALALSFAGTAYAGKGDLKPAGGAGDSAPPPVTGFTSHARCAAAHQTV